MARAGELFPEIGGKTPGKGGSRAESGVIRWRAVEGLGRGLDTVTDLGVAGLDTVIDIAAGERWDPLYIVAAAE